jgi:FixJ family two-component response regulator
MSPSANISQAPLVVIVDDDVSVRRSTARLLRSSGIRAESFASAQHLLDSENTIKADCLIVDVRMPGTDGLQLMRHLRANNQRTPVIFFTGEAAQEDEDWAIRAGALAFLRKPVAKGALLRLVRWRSKVQSMLPNWPRQTKYFEVAWTGWPQFLPWMSFSGRL